MLGDDTDGLGGIASSECHTSHEKNMAIKRVLREKKINFAQGETVTRMAMGGDYLMESHGESRKIVGTR